MQNVEYWCICGQKQWSYPHFHI